MKTPFVELSVSTILGTFNARYSEKGLTELTFPNGKMAASKAKSQNGVSPKIHVWHKTTEATLKQMLAGHEPKKFPPLDIQGTEFQKSVWREMLKIPYGKTKSYGEVAQAMGKPKAVRAVGSACGANSIPIFVPCHRVLAANSKIGGFGSGLGWKCKLLELEGIAL